jgi:hypothetical protein
MEDPLSFVLVVIADPNVIPVEQRATRHLNKDVQHRQN